MKLILELSPEEIDFSFKSAYDENQLHLHQLERYHFSDKGQQFWDDANEVWYYRKEYIGDATKIQLK